MHQWFYQKKKLFAETNEGPYSDKQILQLCDQGEVSLQTLVLSPSRTKNQWVPASQINALAIRIQQRTIDVDAVKRSEAEARAIAKTEKQQRKTAEREAKLAGANEQQLSAPHAQSPTLVPTAVQPAPPLAPEANTPAPLSGQANQQTTIVQNNVSVGGAYVVNNHSIGLCVLLAFLFGPIGLLYGHPGKALVLILITLCTLGFGIVVTYPLAIVFAFLEP